MALKLSRDANVVDDAGAKSRADIIRPGPAEAVLLPTVQQERVVLLGKLGILIKGHRTSLRFK